MKKSFIRYLLFIMIIAFHQTIYATGYEEINFFQIILKLLLYIGIFIVVIFITIYGTKLIAKGYKSHANSKYINLLDTLSIPGGTKIVIVKISKKIYMLSISSNSTEVIDIINEDEFLDEDFSSYLDKYTNKNNNKINLGISKIIEKVNFSKDKEDEK